MLRGPKFLYKNVACGRTWLKSKFIFERKNLTLNAIKNAGGKNVAIFCDLNWVNQEFFKMLKRIEPLCTTNMFVLFEYIHLTKIYWKQLNNWKLLGTRFLCWWGKENNRMGWY